MQSSIVIVIFLFSVGSVVQGAKCPTINSQSGFDLTKFAGVWYETNRSFVVSEIGMQCVNTTFMSLPDGSTGVQFQAMLLSRWNYSLNGTVTVKSSSQPGALSIIFPNNNLASGDYNVLSTDYNTYAVIYSCYDIGFWIFSYKWESLWILSRTKILPKPIMDIIVSALSSQGVSASQVLSVQTNQSC